MVIIKHGKFTHWNTCRYCGCEFGYLGSEILRRAIPIAYTSLFQYEEYIYCPECNAKIIIKEGQT